MGKVYFISDAHLGSLAIEDRLEQEKRLVRFLDSIRNDAEQIYMLGDMFDFWYEYRYVVPKGFTRFLGKISELTDNGVQVHYLLGNHDMWMYGYLQTECGVILHEGPVTVTMGGKKFFLAHGDGMGDPDRWFRILRRIFYSKTCRFLFSLLPTCWSMKFGLGWAGNSMEKHRLEQGVSEYLGEDREFQVLFAKDYLKTHPDINYFVMGHRHIELDLMLSRSSRILILGDWISHTTYACFDGERLLMDSFEQENC